MKKKAICFTAIMLLSLLVSPIATATEKQETKIGTPLAVVSKTDESTLSTDEGTESSATKTGESAEKTAETGTDVSESATEDSQVTTASTTIPPMPKKETGKITPWDDYNYTTVNKNAPLTAESFVENLEIVHAIKVTEIAFEKGAPDTSKVGMYTADILLTTEGNEPYSVKLGYLVTDTEATIKINNFSYDTKKRKVSLTTEPNVTVYLTADSEPVTWQIQSDKNGKVEATLGSTPKKISIFASDGKGRFSSEFHFNVPKGSDDAIMPLYSIAFDANTLTLTGQTLPHVGIQISTESGIVKNGEGYDFFQTDDDGNFSVIFDHKPKTIKIEIFDHKGNSEIYFLNTEEEIDADTNQKIADDSKKLPQTGEKKRNVLLTMGGAILILSVAIGFYRKLNIN